MFDKLFILSRTKLLHFLNVATVTSVNFAVSAHTLTLKQPTPLPPPSFILNLTTVTLSIITFQTACQLNRLQQIQNSCARAVVKAPKSIHVTPILTLHWLKVNNTSNINFSVSPTKFLQPLNLAIFTTLSLFNLLAVPAPHLLSLFLASQPFPWKSQIDHWDMHHLVFGINFPIYFVSLIILYYVLPIA